MQEHDYIVNAFTKEGANTNLEVNNLNVGCITSKNNKFELDQEGNLTVRSIKAVDGIALNNAILSSIYPVGSIYMNVNSTNPGSLFGGVWEQLKDRFLLATGDTYQNETTGGEAVVSLTAANLAPHAHGFTGTTDGNGNHSHTGNTLEVRAQVSGQPSSDTARPISSGAHHYGLQITNDAGWHQHTITGVTQNTGNGQAHNNMPYINNSTQKDLVLLNNPDYNKFKKLYENMNNNRNLEKEAVVTAGTIIMSYEYYKTMYLEENPEKLEISDLFQFFDSDFNYNKYKNEIIEEAKKYISKIDK